MPLLACNLLLTACFTTASLTVEISSHGCKVYIKGTRQTILNPVCLGRRLVVTMLCINTVSTKHVLMVKGPTVTLDLLVVDMLSNALI